jgi:glyoxylase-like metal-dependent hydrolase (beta-lactamase superfamily II)
MWRTALLMSVVVSLVACDGKGPALKGDYPAVKLTDRVYVIHGINELPDKRNQGFINNPGFVLTSKGVVVVDPGSSVRIGEMVLAKISGVTKQPVIAVFNTHVHGDHWLGNQAIKAAYPKAVIYAHPNMKSKAPAAGAEWVGLLNRLTDGAVKGTEPVGPDTHVDHDEILKLGDRHFRIYHNGKAHTDGDVMIEVVEEKTMFLGDNVFAGRIGRMDDGHFAGNVAAIEMAMQSGASQFVPGHGPSNGRNILVGYRDYLRTLHDEVKRYYDQGLQDFEMKPKIAESLIRFQKWYGFDEQLGRHISLAYQQIQAESF